MSTLLKALHTVMVCLLLVTERTLAPDAVLPLDRDNDGTERKLAPDAVLALDRDNDLSRLAISACSTASCMAINFFSFIGEFFAPLPPCEPGIQQLAIQPASEPT